MRVLIIFFVYALLVLGGFSTAKYYGWMLGGISGLPEAAASGSSGGHTGGAGYGYGSHK